MGQPRPIFVYFCSFEQQFQQKICRLQRDSNSDHWNGRPLDHTSAQDHRYLQVCNWVMGCNYSRMSVDFNISQTRSV